MIRRLLTVESTSFDPYHNLAVEQSLLESVGEGTCILYLWQNENTVVIGKNQNPWKECGTSLLTEEGGRLARRLSGGGAVFHDLGNLNFTFLMPRPDYDLDRQSDVICGAVRALGIPAERSGRNDILAGDRKFSGNAFYKNGKQAYHHGTLLVDADLEKLGRYLSPSKAKLRSKGVDSVRSRVVNLKALAPGVTVDTLKDALRDAFSRVYGLPAEPFSEERLDRARVRALEARNRSWEWNYGQKLPFTFSCEGQFGWGSVQLLLNVEHGLIRQAAVYSDAMDWTLAPKLEARLTGCRLELAALMGCFAECETDEERDVLALLRQELL